MISVMGVVRWGSPSWKDLWENIIQAPTEPDWWLNFFPIKEVAPIPSYQLDHLPWKGSKKLSNYIEPRVKLFDYYFEEYFNERNLLSKSPSSV